MRRSVYYWAAVNDIPVFCPSLTDGSIGDMIYFHSYENPGLILDIAGDIRGMNSQATFAKKVSARQAQAAGITRMAQKGVVACPVDHAVCCLCLLFHASPHSPTPSPPFTPPTRRRE